MRKSVCDRASRCDAAVGEDLPGVARTALVDGSQRALAPPAETRECNRRHEKREECRGERPAVGGKDRCADDPSGGRAVQSERVGAPGRERDDAGQGYR